MPLVLALGLILAAAMIAGGITALILFPARNEPEEADQKNENARRQRLATEHDATATARFQTALDACRGLPSRLTQTAEAAEAKPAPYATQHKQD